MNKRNSNQNTPAGANNSQNNFTIKDNNEQRNDPKNSTHNPKGPPMKTATANQPAAIEANNGPRRIAVRPIRPSVEYVRFFRARYMSKGGDWSGWFDIQGYKAEEIKGRILALEDCHRSGMIEVKK